MLEKRKYKRAEVEEILDALKSEYNLKIADFKERLSELSAENRKLSEQLAIKNDEYAVISASIKSAQEKAEEIEKAAENKFRLEVATLKTFSERFKNYIAYLTEKYPHYQPVKNSVSDLEKISSVIDGKDSAKEKVKKADAVISKKVKAPFNPQEKINEYIANTGENGFNLDEVLNPGELHLGELCKELGLTDDN